ncbi:cobalamin biosynthesis protein CobW [Psychromonas sp. psych-6C06]|uniref:cobalamin biosynthesis protein CobW n=1 Tax=Psychromonas sp. psych-6C06 TaxID=2058089 RepID=UPI000C32E2E2|nr:cobalamin biosynthesis protein CobW [Psychromonas sp. psych-6C06]PKF61603.1 cobalamin biosynthesis protein CobW [Psychromonas sp. psych-6C06]
MSSNNILSTTPALNKVPTTVVTGFLGSGKTTLLANLLKKAKGKRIAVIMNEFGELDIDSELLRTCPFEAGECEDDAAQLVGAGDGSSDGIYELANGCICCTVEEEFLPVMEKLVERRDQIDHILIETSGLALPKPLVQAFNWPGIKEHCTVDAVITVVDGPAIAAGRFANDEEKVQAQRALDDSLDHDPSLQELLDDQLNSADLVVVSKSDLLNEGQQLSVQEVLKTRLPNSVKTAYVNNGNVPLEVLIGINAESEKSIDAVHNHHDHHHAHGAHHDHAHDHFDSMVISLGTVNAQKLTACVETLLNEYNLFRIKGFAAVEDKPMRQVLQAVGKRLDTHFDRLWSVQETAKTELVLIGKGLDEASITSLLKTAEV